MIGKDPTLATSVRSMPVLTPRRIYEELDKYVIGQERAKRTVAIAAYNHIKRIDQVQRFGATPLKKSNTLLIGPTGCGKTHIARNLARILDVPFVVVDATEYTEAGYYGKDVEVMIAELLFACDQDVGECERGIIFIDEIDKVARRSGGSRTGAGSRDIGGEGVQQALLKLLEGRKVFVPMNVTQHWNKHDFTLVDTSNILFITAGTFADLRTGVSSSPAGFEAASKNQASKRISQKKLMEFGLIPELLGRLPVQVQLQELSKDDLLRILVEPPDSVVKEYTELFKLDGLQLEFSPEALREVVRFSIRSKLGARGLRTIMEEAMHDLMFTAPEREPGSIKIDGEYIRKSLEQCDDTLWREED